MKKITKYIIILLSLFNLSFIFSKDVYIRPVKVKVIDSVTKKPLEGIMVIRLVSKVYINNTLIFCIPSPDPVFNTDILIYDKKISDSNGEVIFNRLKKNIHKKEKLLNEQIIINLDVNIDKLKSLDIYDIYKNDEGRMYYKKISDMYIKDLIYRPNKIYYGYYLMEDIGTETSDSRVGKINYNLAYFDWKHIDWESTDQEEFVIELTRYKDVKSNTKRE